MTRSRTVTTEQTSSADILAAAARAAGFDTADATLIRDGANVLYQLPGERVARIGPPGARATAEREVVVARWLASAGIPTVQPLDDAAQPTLVANRPVTWWEHVPDHRHGTTAELGALLRELHNLRAPSSLTLPSFDPFVGLAERIAAATHLSRDDRDWLSQRRAQLHVEYHQTRPSQSRRVIHGDAWQGNVVVTTDRQPRLLDLEHVSHGDPDWDLIPIAVDHTDFARLTIDDYWAFVDAYGGNDVTAASDFRLLADIQELRWVCFVLAKATRTPAAVHETEHRIACLRGDVSRPWTWTAF